MSTSFSRALRHLVATDFGLHRAFDRETLAAIEATIRATERTHGGEIRFAIEGNLGAPDLWRGVTPRERALHVFSILNVWDTEANNGVLVYILWADHDVEIVADRGFNGRVTAQEWMEICQRMKALFAEHQPKEASLEGIRAVGALIGRHFPSVDRNEQPDRPVIL